MHRLYSMHKQSVMRHLMRNVQRDSPIAKVGTHPKKKHTAARNRGAMSKHPKPSGNAQRAQTP